MRRIQGWTREQIIAYNLRYDGTAVSIFADTQTGRVNKAREIISTIMSRSSGKRMKIIEPGCSAGDISGFFSEDHDVLGYDVVPAAVAATRERYPKMEVIECIAEDQEPQSCDILVLCEFLEHIDDPVALVKTWMPLAQYVVIGHPLVEDGWDPEEGHIWAYYPSDYDAWWPMGGHRMVESWTFPMGYNMIIGWGERVE
jgi:hypothetical protein